MLELDEKINKLPALFSRTPEIQAVFYSVPMGQEIRQI